MFTVDATLLANKLKLINNASATRSTLPILSNVLIDADKKNGMVELACTNLEVYSKTSFPVICDKGFKTTVSMHDLSAFVATLRGNVDVSKTAKGVELKCGTAKASLVVIDADEFPMDRVMDGKSVLFRREELTKMIGAVAFSASTDEARPILNTCNLKVKDKKLNLAATDGFRLAVYSSDVDYDDVQVSIPVSGLDCVSKMEGELISVYLDENAAQFVGENFTSTINLMSGNFPDYNAIVPKVFNQHVVFSQLDWLTKVLKRSLMFDDLKVIMGKVDEGILFSAASEDHGDFAESVPFDTNVENVDKFMCLNTNMLLDIVGVAGKLGKVLKMEMNGAASPVKFTVEGVDNWLAVQMPMHVS
jgi:DNA polymerase-3 subunit beta